jgi:hypothetical protein
MADTHYSVSRALSHDDSASVQRSADILRRIFGHYERPDFAVRLWDGSQPITPETGTPRFTLVIRHPGALRHWVSRLESNHEQALQ